MKNKYWMVMSILLALALLATATAKQRVADAPKNASPYILTIGDEPTGTWIHVYNNGTITYGPKYKPDDAAKKFWEAVGLYAPCLKLKDR